jgi:phytoene dehydrogenase-like protein
MTCLVVRGDLRDLGAGAYNLWQFDDANVDETYARVRRGEGPVGAYITSGSLKDPDTAHHAPPGHHTLEIMSLASGDPKHWGVDVDPSEIEQWRYRKSPAYIAKKDAWEAALIERAERAFPGVRERIIYTESSTPLTQGRFTRATNGTCYGISSTPDQFMQKRPHFRGPIPQLIHCGASLRTGHGIVGAMTSGYAAARIIAKDTGRTLPGIW